MSASLKGKRVLVTGSSTGIGAATAILFASHGAHVGVHYCTRKEEANSVVETVKRLSGEGHLFGGDLTDTFYARELIDSFVATVSGIDVLVNNAGAVYDFVDYTKLAADSWDKTFALNARAPFLLTRGAFHHMSGDGGRIVNISTNSVKFGGGANSLHYAASKAALDSLTVGFAREGARFGILVNSIRCGLIETPMQDKIPGYREGRLNARVSMVPLSRAGKPEDVASMVAFLASDAGNFITGQIIPITGGE